MKAELTKNTVYGAFIEVDREQMAHICLFLAGVIWQGYDVVSSVTAAFPDGCQIDIKCVGGKEGEPSWTEAVLFDKNGAELARTDPEDRFEGLWSLEHGGTKYVAEIRSQDAGTTSTEFLTSELERSPGYWNATPAKAAFIRSDHLVHLLGNIDPPTGMSRELFRKAVEAVAEAVDTFIPVWKTGSSL